MFAKASTQNLESLLSDLYAHSVELPALTQLITEIEHELVGRDLDRLNASDLQDREYDWN